MTTNEPRTITLPSGRVATVRTGKGRDLVQASRLAGGGKDPMKLSLAIVSVLVTIDGRPVVVEDVEEMDLPDVMKLMGETLGNDASSTNSILSSFGSTDGSDTLN
jgi:hypothetical protein